MASTRPAPAICLPRQRRGGNYTVYVNPYIVLKRGGYTKHFYIEGQRIVSKLGGGLDGTGNEVKAGLGGINYSKKHDELFEGIVRNLKWLADACPPFWRNGSILTAGKSGKVPPGQVLDGTPGNSGVENFQYYYHPDHLGSTSYITDASGEVYQHLEYFAFGETFVEEHSNTDRTPYLFNGKELDEETGLYYYGARYYDAKTSVWLSVDPMAEMYPSIGAYVYTLNNPINYLDPDGRKVYAANVTDRTKILEYLKDQLGGDNGFSFNNDGFLVYNRKNASGAGAYNKYQKSLAKGLRKVTKNKTRTIQVELSKSKKIFSIPIRRRTDLITKDDGSIKMDKNGLPDLGGALRIVADESIDIRQKGGAFLYVNPADQSNTAYLKMNTEMSQAAEFDAGNGSLTGKSESAVFFHEIIDHGLEFMKTGGVEKSSSSSVDAVKYQNKALMNKGKKARVDHYKID